MFLFFCESLLMFLFFCERLLMFLFFCERLLMFRFYESLLNFSFFRESLGNLPEGVGHLDLEVDGGVGLAGQQYLKGLVPLNWRLMVE